MELLKEQLQIKDEQISQLHQLMAMDRQERERLTQQLDRAHGVVVINEEHCHETHLCFVPHYYSMYVYNLLHRRYLSSY